MALVLADRVQETTATTGTGSITLAGAVSGYQSFAVVGDGNTCYYTIVNTTAWEVGIGTYSTTGPTLARTTVLSNSNGNTSPITLVGASTVFLTYPAEKSVNLNVDGVMAVGQPLGYSDTGLLATFVSTETDYNQVVIQNKSNSPTASANLNISNNVSTGTTGFAELGINSSAFTGTNSFELPGAAYLASASTDLTIGTYGAYNIHFVTNSNDIDAMTIHNDGGISLGELADPGIGNIACNNINLKFQQVVTAAGTTTLTNASPYFTQFTGTTTQTLQLPDATTCLQGTNFVFDNDSTGVVTVKDGAGTTFETIISGGIHSFILESNATVAGTWLRYSLIPSEVEWGTNSLQLSTTVISGGTWQGGTIQSGYGGTGLTTFTAANNALYSTGASTLTAGTLPIAAGGTGRTSFTSGYIPYGNGTSGLNSSSSLQFNGTYLVVGGTTPLGGATNPITAFSSTANNYVQTYVYNANTGTSASADFVAYSDNSTDAHGWADMGFTSSTYADPVYTVTGPNEAYVFGSAPSGAGATGNLVYATDYTGSQNAHQWYVGGFTQLKSAWKMQLTSTGLQLANALDVAYGGSGATTAQGAMNTFAGAVTSGSYLRGNGTNVVMSAIQAADVPTLNQNTTGQAGSVANALTFNTTGGAAAGSTYNGSAARTIDYSTVGAAAVGQTMYIGTTAVAINRGSGSISLTGTSIDGNAATATSASAVSIHAGNEVNVGGSYAGGGTLYFNYADGGSYSNLSIYNGGTSLATITAANITAAGNVTGNAATATTATNQSGGTVSATTGSFSGVLTTPKTLINRSSGAATGIGWYSSTYTAWTDYMAAATTTGCGPYGNITAPSGSLVTSWALRSFIENSAGYGWTWETGAFNATTPTVVAEILSTDGSFRSTGNITAFSDERKKKNWRPIKDNFVELLAGVKHGVYDRTDVELTQAGVSAQSWMNVLAETVIVGGDEDKTLSVNYGNAALVSAVQLAIRVVEQDKRIAKLEALVAQLLEK